MADVETFRQALEYSKAELAGYQEQQAELDAAVQAGRAEQVSTGAALRAAKKSGNEADIFAAQVAFDRAQQNSITAEAAAANNQANITRSTRSVANNTVALEAEQSDPSKLLNPPTGVNDPAVQQTAAQNLFTSPAPIQVAPQPVSPTQDPAVAQTAAAAAIPGIQGGAAAVFSANNTNISDGGKTTVDAAGQGAQASSGAGFIVTANGTQTVEALKANAQSQQAAQQRSTFRPAPDWRVRISLAPGATYFYKAKDPGILQPLQVTDGVIFPYTPTISVGYSAQYDNTSITHSNYKILSYQGSAVDNVTIGGEFTAQDTAEANYLLAAIHFFRSCTKMFYGQDTNPRNGVPPPLVYLSGFGAYQFDNHPMVITGFTLQLPSDVDYIRATGGGAGRASITQKASPAIATSIGVIQRLFGSKLGPGGISQGPQFRNLDASSGGTGAEVTYVPTKISLSIQASPIVTRNDISNNFSLRDYASGKLLRGSQRSGTGVVSGGMW